jgi:hypothetical protein
LEVSFGFKTENELTKFVSGLVIGWFNLITSAAAAFLLTIGLIGVSVSDCEEIKKYIEEIEKKNHNLDPENCSKLKTRE